jgi:hypothetical protein
VVKLLLEGKLVDAGAKNSFGSTPRLEAEWLGYEPVV